MRFSLRTLLVVVAAVAVTLTLVVYIWSPPRYTATVLSRTSMRTTAPRSIVAPAIDKLYVELRLRHFMDNTGRVVFADGGSTDTTSTESAKTLGEYAEGTRAFDDPDGNRVSVTWYSEPDIGTLITWEYAGGKDPQIVSVLLQKELAKSGVVIKMSK